AAVYVGKKLGSLLESKAEMLGGLILIGLGTKILLEHLEVM
ncbi:manganese efflux pump, partial [Sulfuricurvum sp. RIFOXYD12_FULL_44_77]